MIIRRFILKIKPTSRGQTRLMKASLTASSSLALRLISMGISLISIPLTAKYLGAERFGLWLILSTFMGWVSVIDFGLANSLKNTLAIADGKQDQEKAKVAVSSIFWLTISISLFIWIVFYLGYPWVSWSKVFNVSSPIAKAEADLAVIVVFILILARLILSIPENIYHAYQEGYLYNIWEAFSSIISIAALTIAIIYKASLPFLLAASFGTYLLGSLFSAIHIFIWRRPWLKPSLTYFRWNQAYLLLKTGFQFWLAQISAILLLQTDLILVAQLFGTIDVAKYGVSLKLFGLISVVQMTFLFPLWAAYAEAIARKDFKWVIKTFKHSFWLSMIWVITASGCVVVFGQQVIQMLTNKDTVPGIDLLLAMSLTTIITGFTQPFAMLLNGLGEVKIQFLLGPPSGIINLIVSVILGRWLGYAGISLGTAVTIALTLLIFVNIVIKKINKLDLEANIFTLN